MDKENFARVLYSVNIFIFLVYILFWIFIRIFDNDSALANLFSDTYGLVALFGALTGLTIFNLWGGFKSKLGSSIFWFSFGLLFQFLGQVVSTYYRRVLGVDAPYPSFAEFFYFGSIFIYMYAVYLLAHLAGIRSSLKLTASRFLIFLVPVCMLTLAYVLFLNNYDFQNSDPVTTFLDFAYPISQALQVSFAIYVLFLIMRSMGGVLKLPAISLVVALILQYLADTYFTYRYIESSVKAGGITDAMYLLAYYVMCFAIFTFFVSYTKLDIKNASTR